MIRRNRDNNRVTLMGKPRHDGDQQADGGDNANAGDGNADADGNAVPAV